MNTIIAAGGSGARLLEALLHLCAVGVGPDKLRILMIDSDRANGNFSRTKELIEKYQDCYNVFHGKIHPNGNYQGNDGAVKKFPFHTTLDLMTDSAREPQVWAPVSVNDTLGDLINYDSLGATDTKPKIIDLFLTKEERNQVLNKGFLGHPAPGAAAMSLVSTYANEEPWKSFLSGLKREKDAGSAKVIIAGSVFGGTGAAALHPIARYLKESLDSSKLLIGAIAVTPYFWFSPKEDDEDKEMLKSAARSEWFPIATKSAVSYYDHLREIQDWPFDAIYWVGDAGDIKVPFALGSSEQRNPAHFVDLIGATASLDFFRNGNMDGASLYSCPRDNVLEHIPTNIVGWDDLPVHDEDFQDSLHRFLLINTFHKGFMEKLLSMNDVLVQPCKVPWYYNSFYRKGSSLTTEDERKKMDLLSEFFSLHNSWWKEINMFKHMLLTNQTAFHESENELDLTKIGNLLYPNDDNLSPNQSVDYFVQILSRKTRKIDIRRRGDDVANKYVALLLDVADKFILKMKNKIS